MSSRRSRAFPLRPALRRPWPRVWACLSLVLAMVAAPWWQQAAARNAGDIPAMAICSVTNGGGSGGSAPLHLAGSHCPLCCGSQPASTAPGLSLSARVLPGFSYPLSLSTPASRQARLAPGTPRARAPPV